MSKSASRGSSEAKNYHTSDNVKTAFRTTKICMLANVVLGISQKEDESFSVHSVYLDGFMENVFMNHKNQMTKYATEPGNRHRSVYSYHLI